MLNAGEKLNVNAIQLFCVYMYFLRSGKDRCACQIKDMTIKNQNNLF